jgi:uncharacterized protein (DUF983 family)
MTNSKDKVITFTTVDFKCEACGFVMSLALTDDPDNTFKVGNEIECFACNAKYKITAIS